MTTYLGYPVLLTEPNRRDAFADHESFAHRPQDLKVGPWDVDPVQVAMAVTQEMTFTFLSRSEVTDFKAFVEGQYGRCKPFWFPTWQRDFELTADVGATDDTITVLQTKYTAFSFPRSDFARRHLALTYGGGGSRSWLCRGVTSADDAGDTEILTINTPTGVTLSKDTTDVCLLRLVRFDSDDFAFQWLNQDVCEISIQVTELALEAPEPA